MFIDVLRVVVTGLVGVYLAAVVFVMAFQVALLKNPQLAPSRMSVIDIANRGMQQSGRTKRLAIAALALPAEAAAWPAAVARRAQARAFESRLSDFHFSSALSLRPLVLIQSACGFALAVACALLTGHDSLVWRPALIVLTVFLLAALVAKHLNFAISGLHVSLRRSLYSPFAVFAAIALFDAAALVLLAACMRSRFGMTDAELSKDGLANTAGAIFNVPSNLVELTSLGPAALAMAAVGVVYSTALARSLLQPSQFQRTDEDRLALANLLTNVGDIDRAEQHLVRVANVNVSSLREKARIQAARGKFEVAVQSAKKASAMAGDDESDEAAVVALARWWIYTSVDLEVVSRFVLFAIDKGMPDYVVAEAVQNRAMLAGADPTGTTDILEPQLDALPATYPLTKASLLLDRGDFAGAEEELRQNGPIDDVAGLWHPFLLMRTVIQDPQRSWNETVADVSSLIEMRPTASLEALTQGLAPTQQQFAGIQVFVAEAWLQFLEVRAAKEGVEVPASFRAYRTGLMVVAEQLVDSPSTRRQLGRIARDLLKAVTGERLEPSPQVV